MTVAEAAARIRAGELVAFPTETVYGLGANALDATAVAKIYVAKGRPSTSPLIVHVCSMEMVRSVVRDWPEVAQRLAEKHWPGPLTMVLPKADCIPDAVTAGLSTVGVRMPRHPIALELIRAAGVPIAAPSANKFTGLSPTTAQHVRDAFGDAIPVLEGGASEVGLESTVVTFEGAAVRVLRPGMLTQEDFVAWEGSTSEAHPSPGMHERHYSPRTPLYLIEAGTSLPDGHGAVISYTGGGTVQMPKGAPAYAARLYDVLHSLDRDRYDWIAVELPPRGPEWEAIHDRLRRARSKG